MDNARAPDQGHREAWRPLSESAVARGDGRGSTGRREGFCDARKWRLRWREPRGEPSGEGARKGEVKQREEFERGTMSRIKKEESSKKEKHTETAHSVCRILKGFLQDFNL